MVTSKVTEKKNVANTDYRPYELLRTLSDDDRRRIIANNDPHLKGCVLEGGILAP